jgi:hypothetical protein
VTTNMEPNTILPAPGTTQNIPRTNWIPTLETFTRANRGAHAELQVMSNEIGRFVELEDRPFDGITADLKDNEDVVWIVFGATPESNLSHGIHDATAIYVRAATETHGAAVEVDSKDGTKTILELSRPEDFALPPPGGTQQPLNA